MILLRKIMYQKRVLLFLLMVATVALNLAIYKANTHDSYLVELEYIIWSLCCSLILMNHDELELIHVSTSSTAKVAFLNFCAIMIPAVIVELISRGVLTYIYEKEIPLSWFLMAYFSLLINMFFYSSLAFMFRAIKRDPYLSFILTLMFFFWSKAFLTNHIINYLIRVYQTSSAFELKAKITWPFRYKIMRLLDINLTSYDFRGDVWWYNRFFFLIISLLIVFFSCRLIKKRDISK